ncbi:MAG: glycosyltransferase [Bdellovibrionota bacterium]
MRVAIVHDWLTGMRGGEYVLEAMIGMYPDCDLFTLLHVPGALSPTIESRPIRTSKLQSVPGAARWYRHFLPLMPRLIEQFDLTGYDLVISSSHCVAKGVHKPRGSFHVSYVHAPMRYIWDLYDDYFGKDVASLPVRIAARTVRGYLRSWDQATATPDKVDVFLANSRFVAEKISRIYHRESTVVHPFANHKRFQRPRQPTASYLMSGAFAPNKRVDLAIMAFNEMKLPLRIVGGGQDEIRLRAMAGPNITFLGQISNTEIEIEFSKARAFVFPGIEDFGITPIEAMAAGCPVIAYQGGGVLESVTPQVGMFFKPQTAAALQTAVTQFELDLDLAGGKYLEADIRKQSQLFTENSFRLAWNRALPDRFQGHI